MIEPLPDLESVEESELGFSHLFSYHCLAIPFCHPSDSDCLTLCLFVENGKGVERQCCRSTQKQSSH